MPSAAIRSLIAALVFAAGLSSAAAQDQSAQPATQPKPYKQVAVTLPEPVADPTFISFRRQLADLAQRKDRAALGALVVEKGFFWERESGDAADEKKSGLENLAAAIGLDAPDGSGWEFLADYAAEASASPLADQKDVTCAPASPDFDEVEFVDLLASTETNPIEWGYPLRDGVEARTSAKPDGMVLEKLGLYFVRVVFDDSASDSGDAMLRVVLPSGQYAFVAPDDLSPVGLDQLCYLKQNDTWRITGFLGEGAQ